MHPLTRRPKICRCTRYSKRNLATKPRHFGSARCSDISPCRIHVIRPLVLPKGRLQNHLAYPPRQRLVALQNIHGWRSRRTTSRLASTLVVDTHPCDESASQFRSNGNGISMVHSQLDPTWGTRLGYRCISNSESVSVGTDEICQYPSVSLIRSAKMVTRGLHGQQHVSGYQLSLDATRLVLCSRKLQLPFLN
jgi:hypothetical protein